MDADLSYLRRAYDRGALVPFIGAGLSSAAAGLPSWPALLPLGLKYAAQARTTTANQLADHARALAAKGDLIGAFSDLQELLGTSSPKTPSIEYEGFLSDVFAEPEIVSTRLLEALHYLQPRRIVTTNYDSLLERFGLCGGVTTTWQDPAAVRDIFRLGEGIVHLHGSWDLPKSVILSRRDYEGIAADASAKRVAQVIFHSGVLLFVGTSLDGTHDPHLGDLLREFEELSNPILGERSPHVMLLPGKVGGEARARLKRQGIQVVSYGESHADLPQLSRKNWGHRTGSDQYGCCRAFDFGSRESNVFGRSSPRRGLVDSIRYLSRPFGSGSIQSKANPGKWNSPPAASGHSKQYVRQPSQLPAVPRGLVSTRG